MYTLPIDILPEIYYTIITSKANTEKPFGARQDTRAGTDKKSKCNAR